MSKTPKPSKTPMKVKVTLYIDDSTWHAFQIRAAERRVKFSTTIEELLRAWTRKRTK